MFSNLRIKLWMETIFIHFRYVFIGRVRCVKLPMFYIANTYSEYFLKCNEHLLKVLYSIGF